ncbi:uncharacterized protein LOC144582618 [Callithrix jacchus]
MRQRRSGRSGVGSLRGPRLGPGAEQHSLLHPRPQPVPLRSPLRRRRYGMLHREQDPQPPLDRSASRMPAPKLVRLPRLEPRQEPGKRPHSRPSRGMPGLCPTVRTRRGPGSYSKGRLVPGPLAWGLERQRASGQPAAYIGQQPGVSGPERAASIRELEEACRFSSYSGIGTG